MTSTFRTEQSILEMTDPFHVELKALLTKHLISGADRFKRNAQIRTYLLFALAERFVEEQADMKCKVPELLTMYAQALAKNIEMVHKINHVKKGSN